MPRYDYHTHSNYSDGDLLWRMADAADRTGLDGFGVADHCHVSDDAGMQTNRDVYGFNLDITYERRRRGIEHLRESFDMRIYDAVEMDYFPGEEARIEAFLDEAGFDYAIGSVHQVGGRNIQSGGEFRDDSDADREAVVDDYYRTLVSLVDSELFDIAAHPDLVERTPALRGFATQDHYDRVAEAFQASRTVPEVNAGRALREYGEFHPSPEFMDTLLDHGVEFVVGTDSHKPAEIGERGQAIDERLAELGVEPAELDV
jgi:histidinol-phosphatase (PHP family)